MKQDKLIDFLENQILILTAENETLKEKVQELEERLKKEFHAGYEEAIQDHYESH